MAFSSFSCFLVINRQFVRSCLNHQNKEPEKRTIMKNEQFFIKEIKATFNLRKPKSNAPTNIYLVVRIQNKQTKLATGVKVYPSHWDNQKHEAIISRRYTELDNMNNEIVNSRIEELKTRFNDFKHYLCSHPELTSEIHTIIKEHIYKGEMEQKKDNALLWFDKEIEAPDKNIAPDTKYGYHQKLKRLEEYVNTLDVDYLTFDMVNEKLVSDFQKWMFEPYDDEGNIRSTRTVHNTIVGIKTILCWAKEYISKEDYNDIKDFKPVKVKKEKTKIVLTDKEILQLYKVELEGTEKAIRDVFIFQCEIGQRFEDISELVNGKYDETEKTYTIVQKKTRQSVTIPLTDVALEILSNYDFKLPEYSLVYSNKILKAVADKAGLHREELITKEEKGKITTSKEPIYKHLSSHCARRSFVTNWLKAGLDSNIIKGVTGHRTDEAFQRYNQTTSKDAASVMQKAQKGEIAGQRIASPVTSVKCSNKNKSSMLEYCIAAKTILNLIALQQQGINIYQLPELPKVMATIKNVQRLEEIKDTFIKKFNVSPNKESILQSIEQIDKFIWNVGKRKADPELYQMLQHKLLALGLSDYPIISTDDLHQIWQQELLEEELNT